MWRVPPSQIGSIFDRKNLTFWFVFFLSGLLSRSCLPCTISKVYSFMTKFACVVSFTYVWYFHSIYKALLPSLVHILESNGSFASRALMGDKPLFGVLYLSVFAIVIA